MRVRVQQSKTERERERETHEYGLSERVDVKVRLEMLIKAEKVMPKRK